MGFKTKILTIKNQRMGKKYEYTTKSKEKIVVYFIKEYVYKGFSWFIVKDEKGKTYQVNPSKLIAL